MAIRTFNSVGGFSVGEASETIILSNGDITTDFATFTANVDAGKVKTDYLLHANGVPWDFNYASGSNGWVQFKAGDDLAASANLIFVDYKSSPLTPATLTLLGTANVTDLVATSSITAPDIYGNIHGTFQGTVASPGSDTQIVFNDNGNLNAVSGLTFVKSTNALTVSGNVTAANADLGNLTTSNYFHGKFDSTSNAQPNITSVGTLVSLAVTGNANAGNIGTSGVLNVTGNANVGNLGANIGVFTGNVTAANLIGPLANGNSNVNIPTANGNVTVSVAGNSNVVVVTGTGVNVAGTMNVTGNVTVGNIIGTFANGNSNVSVPSANGNVNISAVGNANVVVVTGTGINVAGTLNATGNANVGNLGATIGIFTGNLSAANLIGTLANGNSNVSIPDANGNVNISATGTANVVIVTGTGVNVEGTLNASGNANVGNLGAEIGIFTGNLSAANITGPLASGNSNVNIPDANGNVNISATGTANVVVVTSTGVNVAGTLNATGNANVGNLGATVGVFTGNIYALNANLGNLTKSNYFSGTLDSSSNAQPNITSVGTLTALTVTGTTTAGNFSTGGNISATGNITATGNLSGNNATISNKLTAGSIELTGDLKTIDANLGNLVTANYFHGKFDALSNAQPNITSVGTLVGLEVTGNANVTNTVNTGNLNVTAKVVSSLIPSADDTYDLGSHLLQWQNAYIGTQLEIGGLGAFLNATSNVLNTDALYAGNNISAGTLTVRGAATLQDDLTVAGNLTVSGSTTYINVTNTSIKDPLIDLGGSGSGANATAYDGHDRGLVLHNFTSGGSGVVSNQAFIWKTTDSEFQAIGNVTDITDNVVTGTLGNMRSNVMFANLTGQVLTASQTGITTLGTLTNLTIAGNLDVQTKANIDGANIRILTASGLKYPTSDGSSAQVLQTDGAGNLSFVTIDTYRIQNGVNNVTVYSGGNVGIKAGGTANVGLFTGSGANISGVLNVSGNTQVGLLNIGDSSLRAATVTTEDTILATIASVSTTGVRGVEFFVKGENSTGTKYSVATVSAVHDSTGNVDFAVYGTVNLGGSTGQLSVITGVGTLILQVLPSSSESTVWTTQYRTI